MADRFDLEQGIMECWNVTSDLELILKQLTDNASFSKGDAYDLVRSLETLYSLKFDNLFKTFESFIKTHCELEKALAKSRDEAESLRDLASELNRELEERAEQARLAEEANTALAEAVVEEKTLDELFNEEEARLELEEEKNQQYVEDEFTLTWDIK